MRIGVIELTRGNINNSHLYLTKIMGIFPAKAIGGSSDANRASVSLEIHSGIGEPVLTDIAGNKRIFRKRAWLHEFFGAHALKAGDSVVVEKTGQYLYHIYPKRG